MSQERALDAKQLADMAHAALDMGLVRIGQELIDAAYELANGREVSGLDELIASLWQVLET